MKRPSRRIVIGAVLAMAIAALAAGRAAGRKFVSPPSSSRPASISIDYPAEDSLFPPDLSAPTWLWRDGTGKAASWDILVTFADGSPDIRLESEGEPFRVGAIDPRCVSPTNEPPALAAELGAAHTWTPDDATWLTIKAHSVAKAATIVISGHERGRSQGIVSRGQVSIRTSRDPVGAPIFYRDVPLMPSKNEKGVIKPLDSKAVPLIAWRLRNVGDKDSHVVMDGLHTCANCHSFSADGRTLGLDIDGPQNDKGLYAVVDVRPHMTIRNENLIAWSTFRGKLGSKLRVGFMSQVSPDARFVITTVNDPGVDQTDYQRRKDPIDLVRNYYVANFTDYRFLQVFYPTRGVLAWYSREAGHLQYLPGADDTRYVHTNAVWTPDGKSLVFARAAARDAYPAGAEVAQYANDPKETPIQYDLYRIPFHDGKGGEPQPILGASGNGMSNSFPKVTPDGRWIVFVQSKNGLLMRPDSQLYIVPAEGGTARRMKCNTARMNSWHSFSPNGRWMVFSSKSRSPYTQMFLTHLDEGGDDSPAILIENATAPNRAVNLPEFVNIPPGETMKIETPVAEYARHTDLAIEAMKNRQYGAAVLEWTQALEIAPGESWAHNSLGVALMETGRVDEAIAHYREAAALNPEYPEPRNNLGEALVAKGAVKEAIAQFEQAVLLDPGYLVAHGNLGMSLARTGQSAKAVEHLKKVVESKPDAADARRNLGHALAEKGDLREASAVLEEAVRLAGGRDPLSLHLLGRVYGDLGRTKDAVQVERQALTLATQQNNSRLVQAISAHLDAVLQTPPTPAPEGQ